jgi:hypothetical protein
MIKKLILIIICLYIFSYNALSQFSYNLEKNSLSFKFKDKNLFYENTEKNKERGVDKRGLIFGINMGMLKGNSYNAMYYNGDTARNENSINYILKNTYQYNEIKHQLNERNFKLYALPNNMSYNASIMVGFYARYNYNNTTGYFISFNFSKLNTNGVFSLSIDSATFTSEPALRYFSIYGQEERTYIDIGLHKEFYLGDKSNFFVEGGINFTNTLVKKNGIVIGNLDYSIINVYGNQPYTPGSGAIPYEVRQGGIGFGFFGGCGVNLNFNDKISVDPGLNLYYQSINLLGYEQYRLNYFLYVRLMMRNFL